MGEGGVCGVECLSGLSCLGCSAYLWPARMHASVGRQWVCVGGQGGGGGCLWGGMFIRSVLSGLLRLPLACPHACLGRKAVGVCWGEGGCLWGGMFITPVLSGLLRLPLARPHARLGRMFVCLLVDRPGNMLEYLPQQHAGVSQGRICSDRYKLQIKLSTSPSHSILTPG